MMKVDCATQKDTEAVVDVVNADCLIACAPVLFVLGCKRVDNQLNHVAQLLQDLCLGGVLLCAELALAIPYIVCLGKLCADVIAQIAREMGDKIADAGAIGIGVAPEFFFG